MVSLKKLASLVKKIIFQRLNCEIVSLESILTFRSYRRLMFLLSILTNKKKKWKTFQFSLPSNEMRIWRILTVQLRETRLHRLIHVTVDSSKTVKYSRSYRGKRRHFKRCQNFW